MSAVPPPSEQWFVVHVLSGQERKLRERILREARRAELGAVITDVLMPTERVSEIKEGRKHESTRKFYPGYLFVNAHLLDERGAVIAEPWHFIQQCEGVIGFAGPRNRPVPMRPREIDGLLAEIRASQETVRPKVVYEVGETVRVSEGPFKDQTGVVEEIDPENAKILVTVMIFGRPQPVQLDFWQVERG